MVGWSISAPGPHNFRISDFEASLQALYYHLNKYRRTPKIPYQATKEAETARTAQSIPAKPAEEARPAPSVFPPAGAEPEAAGDAPEAAGDDGPEAPGTA